MSKTYTLLSEIGATNARFALMDEDGKLLGHDIIADSTQVPVEKIIADFLKKNRTRKVKGGYLALAGPVIGDSVVMGNRGVALSISQLSQALGFPLVAFNDLHAHAAGLSHIDAKDMVNIAPGNKDPNDSAPKVIIGIGTGLGMSALIPTKNKKQPYLISPTEAGFTDLPMYRMDFKINGALQRVLKEREPQFVGFVHDHIPIVSEYILSGKGLLRLYQAVCQLEHMPIQPYEPRHITENALSCNQCLKAIEYFIVFLGRFIRNAMFSHGALGGIYLTGGVIQAIHKTKLFDARLLRESCYGVGRDGLDYYMKQIPIYLIKSEEGGIQGLKALAATHPLPKEMPVPVAV